MLGVKQKANMTLSAAAIAAKETMDTQLGDSTKLINIKMGIKLYNELCACGMIEEQLYDPIIFAGEFPFPSYGYGRFVFYDYDLSPYDFRVGDGGMSI